MENVVSPRETLEKAYGSIPKEVGMYHDWGVPTWRGFKYYWYKITRKLTPITISLNSLYWMSLRTSSIIYIYNS